MFLYTKVTNKISSFSKNIRNFIQNYWFVLNIIFLLLIISHQILKKILILKGYYNLPVDKYILFNIPGSILIILSVLIFIILCLIKYKLNIIFKFTLIIIGYVILVIGYSLQKDPEQKWEGSDVSWGNYNIAKETKKYGPLYVIKTWNTRANPYDSTGYDNIASYNSLYIDDLTRKFIKENNLYLLIGNKWEDREKIFVNNNNNRAYIHPPLAPIIMGFWFNIFPSTRWSLQIFMIIINIVSFSLLLIFFKKFNERKNFLPVILSITTSPMLILFNNPSAEQITMLLFGLACLIFYFKSKWNFLIAFIVGIIMAFAFYIKFVIGIYIFIMNLIMIIYFKKIGWKPILGYILGFCFVNILFILLGYYFWLTFIIGKFVVYIYTLNNRQPFYYSIIKLFYFGPSMLLILTYLFTFNPLKKFSINKNIIYLSHLISILLFLFLTWNLATFDRYLLIFIISFFPFLLFAANKMNFSNKDLLIIPISNIIYTLIIIYL